MHVAPFDKVISVNLLLELLFAREKVVDTVLLTCSRGTRRVRYTKLESARVLFHECVNQCALADARRARDDEDLLLLPLQVFRHFQGLIALFLI